ncbi:MAG: hypothetical protein M0P71_12630 [Melioribacteraceae bacterium]|nr:hypothetical protein [Melioribacteraceae bacterium]
MSDRLIIEIKNRLLSVLKKDFWRKFLINLSWFIIGAVLLWFLAGLLEIIFRFSTLGRAIVFFSYFLLVLIAAVILLLIPFIKEKYLSKPDYNKAAKMIGDHFPEIKDELLNTLQIAEENSDNYSHSLIEAAFKATYEKTKNIDFEKTIDLSRSQKKLRYANVLLAAFMALSLLIPEFTNAYHRILSFNTEFKIPQKFYFEVAPGNYQLTKDESITITVKTTGEPVNEVNLFIKSEEQTDFSQIKLTLTKENLFRYEKQFVKNSFEYFVTAQGIKSDHYRINVIDRPVITGLNIKITPPVYTKLPEVLQSDNGNIEAYPGSRITFGLNSSKELKEAKINFSDSTSTALKTGYQKANGTYIISSDKKYSFELIDLFGNTNLNPILYSITTLSDAFPVIELLEPASDIRLAKNNIVQINSLLSDDFGFSKLTVNYKLTSSKYRQPETNFKTKEISIPKATKEYELNYVWNLADQYLAEGEVVAFYLELFDNDNVSGPKSVKTKIINVSVPSLDDLYKSVENTQEDAKKDLEETFKEAEKLSKELEKLKNDLKRDKAEITWDEKEKIEKAIDKFKDITSKIDEASKKLNDMKKEMMENNLLSEETMEKFMELQDLMNELSSEEFKDAMKKLQDSMKNLMRNEVNQSMENFKLDEEMFKKSLERTMNLLKRVQAEMKVDEIIKRSEELAEKMSELKEKTDKMNLSDKQNRDQLKSEQKDATKDFKNLEDEMSNLQKKISELNEMPKDKLDEIAKQLEKQQNQELSENAENNISQNQKNQAQQNQQQMQNNMQNFNKQMQEFQESMQQQNQMETFNAMMKNINDLLSLSKSQEKLKKETDNSGISQQKFNENAKKQSEIQNNLSKVMQNLGELSQKSFAITPEMGKALGQAYSNMQQSISSLQNRNTDGASQSQNKSMENLNQAASMMKSALDMMMQGGGSGSGMMNMFQQLQQMSQQQMNLNQLTQMMQQGKLTQQQMGQMQRLGQQQEMLRKSLEQLNKEAKESGQSKRIASNLDKILDEMKEVVSGLETEKINDDLIKKQENILSKLLDTQRSINEKDFEENRKSNTGKNITKERPDALNLSPEERIKQLRESLNNGTREKYNKDYEELIKKYYEKIGK